MIITVKKIGIMQESEPKNDLNSYWVEFESELTSGQALLYSRAAADTFFSGRQISVEMSQRDIHDFHVVPKSIQAHLGKLVPLSTPSDYEVTGRVAIIYEDGAFFVDIEPGRCSFALTLDKITPISVEKDDWVTFKVLGLELWDEHF
jgi:hypothetical protein